MFCCIEELQKYTQMPIWTKMNYYSIWSYIRFLYGLLSQQVTYDSRHRPLASHSNWKKAGGFRSQGPFAVSIIEKKWTSEAEHFKTLSRVCYDDLPSFRANNAYLFPLCPRDDSFYVLTHFFLSFSSVVSDPSAEHGALHQKSKWTCGPYI